MSMPHVQQPTEKVLAKAQQERERLLKFNEHQAARQYVQKFGVRNGWLEADVLEIFEALGLDGDPVQILDVTAIDF